MLRPALLIVAILACAAPAAAQDAARARQLFEQGVAAMDRGNPAQASTYFQQSYQLFPRASTACNMALSLERTNRGCEAIDWYRQCAALDTAGQFRTHAQRQAAALSQQCPQQSAQQSPFVSGPQPVQSQGGGAQVVEQGQQPGQSNPYLRRRGADHTMLGIGIPALLLGVGAIVGGGFAAGEASYQAEVLEANVAPSTDPTNPTLLVEGSEDADTYYRAETFSNLAIGLYVAGSLLSAVGALLIIIDLARPGAVSSASAEPTGPRFTFGPLPEGGAVGQLTLRF